MTRNRTRTSVCLSVLAATASLAAPSVLPKAGQPTKTGKPGTYEIVGTSGVSAQQMFLGANNAVYIIDKVENNPATVAGHPAWASEYRLSDNNMRPMDIVTNSFCAGGGALGNGTWVNLGGNQAVTWGGNTANSQTDPAAPYNNLDGGKAIRFLDPCEDSNCNWVDDPARYMPTRRWYPTLEPIEDGSLIVIGGNQWGGFVNSQGQNNPTYEFLPARGQPIGLNILTKTLPANLFPLTFLLPSGNLFIQTNWGAEIFDHRKNVEYPLDDIPHAVRTYPASGGSIMLPLTPANNWTATILFCGGSDLQPEQWTQDWAIANYPADASCVKMSPDVSTKWVDDDSLPEGRTMGNMMALPDGTIWMGNGANKGVAGYGNVTWAIGHSYADAPLTSPVIYNPAAPAGSRWSRAGLTASTVNRMYHSTAVLLPDGSLLVSGSNPNPDVITTGLQYPTEYRVERFYPSYYDKKRPDPAGIINQLAYGGPYFNVTLTLDDLAGDITNINKTKAVVIRTGFSTHAMNMGQRYLELSTSYTATEDSATLHVSQMPPNPAIFAPGPAYLYIVVNGVPSVGQKIVVGSGQIGAQNPVSAAVLPPPTMPTSLGSGSGGGGGSSSGKGDPNGASKVAGSAGVAMVAAFMSVVATLLR